MNFSRLNRILTISAGALGLLALGSLPFVLFANGPLRTILQYALDLIVVLLALNAVIANRLAASLLKERRGIADLANDIVARTADSSENYGEHDFENASQQVRDMARLLESRHQYSQLLDRVLSAIGQPAMIVMEDRSIFYANASARSLIGLNRCEVGKVAIDRHLLGIGKILDFAFKHFTTSSAPYSEDAQVTLPAGRRISLQLNFHSMPAEEFQMSGVLIVANDAGAYIDALRSMTSMRDSAEMANKSKGLFLAKMSHELRTPLNGILGMTDLLLEGTLNRDQRRYLEMVKYSANGLVTIVNDILDLSKIEAGRLEINPQPFWLREHIRSFTEILQLRAQQRGLEMLIHIDDAVPDCLVGDSQRLAQVLINLLQNAIKFTFNGGAVILFIYLVKEVDLEAEIQFAVVDSGIGIPPHKLKAVFEPFIQADASTTKKFGGTGLGLAIVSDLVRLMGGNLAVKSSEGVGSVFSFKLPLKRAEMPKAVESDSREIAPPVVDLGAGQNRPHILLVEDNSLNQMIASRLLEEEGYRVSVAGNGKIAVRKFESSVFDLVLMDCQMPEMDGFEAARLIRESERGSARHIPIIAVTALAMAGDREKCLGAGMDDYVTKPIRKDTLLRAIERNLAK